MCWPRQRRVPPDELHRRAHRGPGRQVVGDVDAPRLDHRVEALGDHLEEAWLELTGAPAGENAGPHSWRMNCVTGVWDSMGSVRTGPGGRCTPWPMPSPPRPRSWSWVNVVVVAGHPGDVGVARHHPEPVMVLAPGDGAVAAVAQYPIDASMSDTTDPSWSTPAPAPANPGTAVGEPSAVIDASPSQSQIP
jgi:hypothetical protein